MLPRPLRIDQILEMLILETVHNSFHYEVLAYAKITLNTALLAIVENRIAEIAKIESVFGLE